MHLWLRMSLTRGGISNLNRIVKRDVKSLNLDIDLMINNPKINIECPFSPKFCSEVSEKNHQKFIDIFQQTSIDINSLRNLAWNGVPDCCRLKTWQILSGVLPTNSTNHSEIIKKKTNEYQKLVTSYYENRYSQSNSAVLRQVKI